MINLEERELIIRAKQNDKDALQELINRNINLVRKIAYSLVNLCETLEFDDLVQEGVIAIIKAVDNFDLDNDVKFISYIYMCIKGNIYNAIIFRDRIVRYPAELFKSMIRIRQKISRLTNELGRVPNFEAILNNTDLTYEELIEYQKFNDRVIKLEDLKIEYQSTEEVSNKELDFQLYASSNPEKEAIEKVLIDDIFESYELTDIEKEVLYLVNYSQYPLHEIGQHLGYSQEGIRKINKRSKGKVVKKFKNWK